MSSDVRESPRVRPVVDPDDSNGLRTRSQIMTEKVTPVRRDRVRRVLGTIDRNALERLDRALLVVFGLAR
jgi:mRNA interferase MazF